MKRTLSVALAIVLAGAVVVSLAFVPALTDFDPTYFNTNSPPVTLVGSLTNWAKLSTNTAVGAVSFNLPLSAALLPASNAALLDSGGSGLQFLFAASANAIWQFQMGNTWPTGATMTFRGVYGMDTATSGTCILEADVWAMNSGDARAFTNPNFGSANLTTNTVPGTIFFPQSFAIICTNVGGTIQAGSWVQVKLTRTGTATGNMALQSVSYSSN